MVNNEHQSSWMMRDYIDVLDWVLAKAFGNAQSQWWHLC
jgi:hypothetical protein